MSAKNTSFSTSIKAYAIALLFVGFAIAFITGTIGKMLVALVLWCSGVPAWGWALILLAAVIYCCLHDNPD